MLMIWPHVMVMDECCTDGHPSKIEYIMAPLEMGLNYMNCFCLVCHSG